MFEPYKNDLKAYTTNKENKPFERRGKNLIEIIKRSIYFYRNPHEKNLIEKNKAIIVATIIHKINLNSFHNYFLNNYFIGVIDYNPNGADIDFLYYPFFQYIIEEIKVVDFYEKDNDTYIKILYEKMKSLKDKIESFFQEEKEKYILINYLFKIIIQKLNIKEGLYNSGKLKKETEKIMYKLCNSINSSILDGLESKRNSDILFKNIEFKDIAIKIIRNVSDEKEIFILKTYINKLYNILLDEINGAKANYTFENSLNEKEFKKLLNENREKSKKEKKELIKLQYKKKESKIIISKYNINISNDSNLNSWEEQRMINEDENENICNEISKIINLKKEIEIYNNEKYQNIKGILITKTINENEHFHDKFIVKMIN